MFKHVIITIIAMFLIACGNTNQTNQTQTKASPVVPLVIQVVVDDPALVESVDYGIQWWEQAGFNQLVRVDECDPSAFCSHVRFMTPDERISINNQYGHGGDVGGLTSNDRTLVRMNKDLTLGYLPSEALNISVSHELGHVQGFQHSKDPGDLMFVQPTFTGTICIQGKACREFS
ncbi:MAG TPA: hypothetical protein VHC69_13195 [Polyangiaceae bacterium]|nr:hypothetical protein [Polyangiaceae bacterium]